MDQLVDLKKLFLAMYRASLEYAQLVRKADGPHWRRQWDRAMLDAHHARRLVLKSL